MLFRSLNNFYNKKISFSPLSYLHTEPVTIYSADNNIFKSEGGVYVRKDSQIQLSFNAHVLDSDVISNSYHPNYNIFHITGWGSNQKYGVGQALKNVKNTVSELITDESIQSKPLSLLGVDNVYTTTFQMNNMAFMSSAKFRFQVDDGYMIYVKPEGRIYYNNAYPTDINDIDDLVEGFGADTSHQKV